MSESLFAQLKRLGIDEELASQVSASLDPDYNASKKDVLVMQEAMLQLQSRTDEKMADLQSKTDERYYELKIEIQDVRSEIKDVRSELKTEIHTTINRQYLVTFGSALLTIVTVLAVNWYYHVPAPPL